MRGLGTSAREASEAHGIMAVVETWTCFDCDWDNDVSLSVCEMCDTARDLSCASDLSHSLSLALVVTCSGRNCLGCCTNATQCDDMATDVRA